MLIVPETNAWGWQYSNPSGATSAGDAPTITPGASGAEGAWTLIAAAADVTADVHFIELTFTNGAFSAQQRDQIFDLGIDPAGGTSYAQWLGDLIVGYTAGAGGGTGFGGRHHRFPCYIPAGSQIAGRIQGSHATAGTVSFRATLYGKPLRPHHQRRAAYCETVGAIASTQGVAFTPGNAAWGSWVSLGTTSKALWYWQLGVQVSNAVQASRHTEVQLAFGDATNKHLIGSVMVTTTTSEVNTVSELDNPLCELPAGATLYVRGYGSDAADTGWNAAAYGFGG